MKTKVRRLLPPTEGQIKMTGNAISIRNKRSLYKGLPSTWVARPSHADLGKIRVEMGSQAEPEPRRQGSFRSSASDA